MRVVSVVVLALIAISCSSNGGNNPVGRNPLGACYGTNGQTCTGVDEAQKCYTDKCSAKIDAAVKACTDYVACNNACPCDATFTTCSQACSPKANAACTAALTDAGACFGQCPQPKCTTPPDTGHPHPTPDNQTPHACTDLAACCTTIAQAYKIPCNSVVAAKDEKTCSDALTSYKGSGLCK